MPSSFSVTVRVSPSASVTVYAKLKGAFCFPRFVELALMAGAVFVLTILFMKGGLVGLFCEQLPALLHKERKPKVDLAQKAQKGA